MSNSMKKLRNKLLSAGVVALKAGTESEKQTPEEIAWMQLHNPDFEIRIKIGGPEDCASLKSLIRLGFTNFIAPLVETDFAVKKFIMAAEWATEGDISGLNLDLNIESITGYENIYKILNCDSAKYIRKVNVGKSDLSLSMNKHPDSTEVLWVTNLILQEAKSLGKLTGIGGSIKASSIEKVLELTKPDEVETRNVIMNVSKIKDPVKSIKTALEFELAMVKEEQKYSKFLVNDFDKRINELKKRIK